MNQGESGIMYQGGVRNTVQNTFVVHLVQSHSSVTMSW